MLPTPEIRVWSSSSRLMPAVRRRTRADERVVVELRVERVAGDVGDLGRQLGSARRRPTGRRTSAGRRSAGPRRPSAERREPRPAGGARPGSASRGCTSELAAHAEVAEQRVAAVERQPEVLAASAGGHDPAAGERGGEAGRAARVPAYRARVQHRRPTSMVRPTTWRSRPSRTVSTSGSSGTRSVGQAAGRRATPRVAAELAVRRLRGGLLGLLLGAADAVAVDAGRRPAPAR